jgi:hypothetical protein
LASGSSFLPKHMILEMAIHGPAVQRGGRCNV